MLSREETKALFRVEPGTQIRDSLGEVKDDDLKQQAQRLDKENPPTASSPSGYEYRLF